MNLNNLKSNVFTTIYELQKHRLFLKQQQINEFWVSRTLIEMEQLLTIRNEYINQYIFEYINYYLKQKKVTQTDAFQVIKNQKLFMCIYDCKIFKSNGFAKQVNQMLNSFIFAYKLPNQQQQHNHQYQIFQFYDTTVFHQANSIFKCKASSILKQYGLLKSIIQNTINGDTIILSENYYYQFLINWMNTLKYPQTLHVQNIIQRLFKGLVILLYNSILVAFSSTLSQKQKQRRRYKEPVNIIKKPKNIQSQTMVYNGLGDIDWHTLKIKVFKLKYKVIQTQQQYSCFRVKRDQQQQEDIQYDRQFMEKGDQQILQAFHKLSWIQQTQF